MQMAGGLQEMQQYVQKYNFTFKTEQFVEYIILLTSFYIYMLYLTN